MANMTLHRPLQRLQAEVDRLFDDFSFSGEDGGMQTLWSPSVDLIETGEGYTLYVDLPGLSRDDVKLVFEEGALTISGERNAQYDDDATLVRAERWNGRFMRALRFNHGIEPDRIEAHFENGVLTVNIPKSEPSRTRQIEVS